MRGYQSVMLWIMTLLIVSTGSVSLGNVAVTAASPTREVLSLHCNTFSFLKNNEYFEPYAQGHTLAGYQLHPHFQYTVASGVVTKLGLWLQRDWATQKFFSQLAPTFTLQYQSEVATFLMGTLDGMDQHRLLRPLCDAERLLTQLPETGLRIYHSSKSTFLDLWLHWLTLLNKPNDIPEELLAGFSFEKLLARTDGFTIHLPFQLLLYHLGGQGIAVKDYSLWIGAVGERMNFHIGAGSLCSDISLAVYYVGNQYVKQPHRPVQRGHGLYGEVAFHTAWLTLQISYWHAYGFSSERLGHPLYQAHYCLNPKVRPQNLYRHLIFLHIYGTYHLTDALTLAIHIDPYYDLKQRLLEHEAGLYLSYNLSFNLIDLEK